MTPEIRSKLLAAASGATTATLDMIEAAREGAPLSPETITHLADALRLLVDAAPSDPEATQLHGALIRYLESQL
ncbi:MAG: hypothetical protein EP318_15605 [Rhodobacteraceae bacterium]|nr:MAG: hypothetical protein EP318_15605 [Paracoccaceae bacterium]